MLPFNNTAKQNIVKVKFIKLFFKILFKNIFSKSFIFNSENKTRKNSIIIWIIILILGLGKIFLSDNNPRTNIVNYDIFRIKWELSKKNKTIIIRNVPPIIIGDLFVWPKFLWIEYLTFSFNKLVFLKKKYINKKVVNNKNKLKMFILNSMLCFQ